ncbi:MAG: enoyl-CoA hydratase/isomerase family protein, partial [Anaeromyxobacteraceae bacterium]
RRARVVAALAGGKLRRDEPAPHVTRLTIDNPDKRNALDHEILDALAGALPRLDARCLLLTATGKVFSAGYDIGALPQDDFARAAEAIVAHPFTAAIEALDAFPFPVLAALNGHAIGGGLELALSCDLRVCSADARLGMPPARLGLIYSHTGLRKFIDALGAPRTRELFFTARNIGAEEALRWGLASKVAPPGRLREEALAMAEAVARNAPISLRQAKRAIDGGFHLPLEEALDLENRMYQDCLGTKDRKEALAAFAEKRPPVFHGE